MSNDSVRKELNAFNGSGASPGGSSITIPDFSGVEVKVFHAPPGAYPGKVIGFAQAVSQSSGNPMLVFEFEVDVGGGKVLKRKFYHPLTSNSLWKLARTCGALGIEPGSISVDKVIGLECMVNIIDGDDYDGKPTSDIDSCDEMTEESSREITTAGPVFSVDTKSGFGGQPMPPGPEDDDIPF
jgi:hypothetical protein